jgi:hypothetical protein
VLSQLLSENKREPRPSLHLEEENGEYSKDIFGRRRGWINCSGGLGRTRTRFCWRNCIPMTDRKERGKREYEGGFINSRALEG